MHSYSRYYFHHDNYIALQKIMIRLYSFIYSLVHYVYLNFGQDYKFETDSYDVELHNLMSSEQYTEVIENVNEKMRKSRANSIDGVLLATGPLILPLAVWGVRHRVSIYSMCIYLIFLVCWFRCV